MIEWAQLLGRMFLEQAELNRRVEMLIQPESQFIELDDVTKLVFCREWTKHNEALSSIDVHDKSDFFTALVKASRLLMGSDTEQPGHLIYITDGRLVMHDLQERIGFLESSMPGSIHFIIIHEASDDLAAQNELINQIVTKVKQSGKQASSLTFNVASPSHAHFAADFFSNEFAPLKTTLKFGHLSGGLCIHPRPPGIASGTDLQVVGVIKVSDLDGPPLESRHLVQAESGTGEQPHLVVLMMDSLLMSDEDGADKGRRSCALVKVGNRFGLLQPQETNKRPWLAFWLIPPGDDPLPWFGPLRQLGQPDVKNHIDFPVCDSMARRRSYAVPTIAWTKDKNVTSDVLKLMRAARKLPDKAQNFYRELNKIRRACLAYGFTDLMDGIAQCLDYEQKVAQETKPAAVAAIQRAADFLRSSKTEPHDYLIPTAN